MLDNNMVGATFDFRPAIVVHENRFECIAVPLDPPDTIIRRHLNPAFVEFAEVHWKV